LNLFPASCATYRGQNFVEVSVFFSSLVYRLVSSSLLMCVGVTCKWLFINYVGETAPSIFFPPMAQQPSVGEGLLIIEASRSPSDTPHLVGLLWMSDRSDAETST